MRRWAKVLLAAALSCAALTPVAGVVASTACGEGPMVERVVRGKDLATARTAVEANGGVVTGELSLVNAVVADVPSDAIGAIQRTKGVRSVSPNDAVTVQSDTSTVREATSVYPRVVGADQLWASGVDGAGVTVALIDTGVSEVADLSGRLVGGIDLSGEGDPFKDSYGHGTFVAGVIAGNGAASAGEHKGVAPGSRLVSIKVAGASGVSDVAHLLAAIQWAVHWKDHYSIDVLNIALGTDSTQSYRSSLLNYAVERAWDSGLVVVVAASNRGPDAGTISKPADDPLVITAGALDDAGTVDRLDDTVASFSGRGPTAADGLQKPDLVAPGRSVISLRAPGSTVDAENSGARIGDAYFKGSGTSFATAATSGAAALLLHQHPTLVPDQVKGRLLGTAAAGPVGDPNVDGQGSLDVAAAATTTAHDGFSQAAVPRSLGDGTLDADRGNVRVAITVPSSDACDSTPTLVEVTGEAAPNHMAFDRSSFVDAHWDGATWVPVSTEGTSWYGTSWYGTSWYGTSWYGTSWYGTSWYGTSWYGTSWYGTSWYAATWS